MSQKVVTSYDFQMLEEDHYIYTKWLHMIFVKSSLYVDGILLVRNCLNSKIAIKEWLSLNLLRWKTWVKHTIYLELRSKLFKVNSLSFTRELCSWDPWASFRIVDCKPMCTPVATGVALSLEIFSKPNRIEEDGKNSICQYSWQLWRTLMEGVPYANVVGNLMYAWFVQDQIFVAK